MGSHAVGARADPHDLIVSRRRRGGRLEGMRRTRAERDQDRKLAFVPMWPLVAAIALFALVVFLTTR